jgi:hypothetical protein
MVRQKAIAQTTSGADMLPETALAIQNATQANIAALQSRASVVQCALTPNVPGSDLPH